MLFFQNLGILRLCQKKEKHHITSNITKGKRNATLDESGLSPCRLEEHFRVLCVSLYMAAQVHFWTFDKAF